MTPTEAARIVDRAIATTKRPPRWLLAVAIGVVLVIAGKPTAHPATSAKRRLAATRRLLPP